MKWVKRFAAGALAAALSLALLCGCSGSSIDEGTVIDYTESSTSYMTMETWVMGSPVVYECTNVSSGAKLYVETVKTGYYVGTDQVGVMNIAWTNEYNTVKDKNNQTLALGLYSIDRVNKTYRENGKLNPMERVLGEVMYSCCRYDHNTNTFAQDGPKEIRAASRVKNKKVYYTEIFEYDDATVALYYETENKSSTDTDLKYIEIYLPGEKTARAEFTAKRTSGGLSSGGTYTKMSDLTKAN